MGGMADLGVEVSWARNVAINSSTASVVGLVHRLVRWLGCGWACAMSVGRRWSNAGTAEYLNKILRVCRSSKCRRVAVSLVIFSIRFWMKDLAKGWEPIGWPRKRAPVVISASSGLLGERRARAACKRALLWAERVLRGEAPFVAVRIFVLL